jgi:hypothetical protein
MSNAAPTEGRDVDSFRQKDRNTILAVMGGALSIRRITSSVVDKFCEAPLNMGQSRSVVTLWLLWAVTGLCGGHLFYVGRCVAVLARQKAVISCVASAVRAACLLRFCRRLHGLVALFTLNFVGVGWIVDGFRLHAYIVPTAADRPAGADLVEVNVDVRDYLALIRLRFCCWIYAEVCSFEIPQNQPSVTPAKSTVPLMGAGRSPSPKIAGAAQNVSPDDVVLDGTEPVSGDNGENGQGALETGESSQAQPAPESDVDDRLGLTPEQLVRLCCIVLRFSSLLL